MVYRLFSYTGVCKFNFTASKHETTLCRHLQLHVASSGQTGGVFLYIWIMNLKMFPQMNLTPVNISGKRKQHKLNLNNRMLLRNVNNTQLCWTIDPYLQTRGRQTRSFVTSCLRLNLVFYDLQPHGSNSWNIHVQWYAKVWAPLVKITVTVNG